MSTPRIYIKYLGNYFKLNIFGFSLAEGRVLPFTIRNDAGSRSSFIMEQEDIDDTTEKLYRCA
jgi:hypothetical protein